jgi:hypothetical protein
MSENIDNLILEHLKRFQAGQERMQKDMDEIKSRLGHIEQSIVKTARDSLTNYEEIILNRHMVDRMNDRIERIERRLEIAG